MRAAAAALVLALALAMGAAAACAHNAPLAPAPDARAPAAARARYYEDHAPLTPVPKAALFFSSPLVLRDGTRAEPRDLLPAVAEGSDTARAVARYQAAQAWFTGLFAVGAALQVASTASTIAGVPMLADKRTRDTGIAVLAGGRAAELVGFGVIAAGYFLCKDPILDARDDAFSSYDADLRARLALPPAGAGSSASP